MFIPTKENPRVGIGTTFATAKDLAAYRVAKRRGMSDTNAFKLGDNCIGRWGTPTMSDTAMVAIVPEDLEDHFGSINAGHGQRVRICKGNLSIVATVEDIMPRRRNVRNGAVIDLNPGAAKALGITADSSGWVSWHWL